MPESFLKPALRRYAPYVPGEQPPDGEGWVKLNTNESPLPPSPRVIEAIKAAADDSLRLYPSPTAAPARQAIARHERVRPEEITLGNGGDDLIEMCFRAFAGAGDRVAFATPTYPLFEPLCHIHEAVPAPFPTGEDWSWTEEFVLDPAPLKLIVNPNSPTGHWVGPAEVERAIEQSTGVVVVDEAYVDFAPMNVAGFLPRYQHMLVLRTLSKSYALAGMRVGYAIGNPDLIAALDAVKDSYNLDRLAIVAAAAAIEDEGHHRAIVDEVVSNREELSKALTGMEFEVVPSATNFLFVKPPRPAAEVAKALRERRILVRHYDREPIAGWIRVTIGTREQHAQLLAALKEIL
jgi:histidinol-phosphate aminotransferase